MISTSTARPTPTGVAKRSGCRSCGDYDQASGPTPPRRCPARGTGARHPSRAGTRHSRPARVPAGRPGPRPPPSASANRPLANQLRDPDSTNLSSPSCRSPRPARQERTSAHLPIGVRSDPTPPPRPTAGYRIASTSQAARRRSSEVRVAARGGARGRACPVRHESLARLGKSNRLMLRVLVRHGAPAPCSRSERRCLGEPTPAAVGYPFGGTRIRAGLASRGAVPDAHAEGDARRPAGGEEPSGGPPGAKRSPGCTGKPGDLPSARWRGYPNDVQANRPYPRAEGAYRDARTWSVASGAASTTSYRPMVVMGDSPDGVLEPHVGHPVVRFDGRRGPASKRGGSRLEAGIGRTWRTVPDRLITNSRAAIAL